MKTFTRLTSLMPSSERTFLTVAGPINVCTTMPLETDSLAGDLVPDDPASCPPLNMLSLEVSLPDLGSSDSSL